MDTSIILEAFISVLLEKGIEALGKPLMQTTKRLWKRLHKSDRRFSHNPEALTTDQVQRIATVFDELALDDPSFKILLDEWKREVAASVFSGPNYITAKNKVSGITVGSRINQSVNQSIEKNISV